MRAVPVLEYHIIRLVVKFLLSGKGRCISKKLEVLKAIEVTTKYMIQQLL